MKTKTKQVVKMSDEEVIAEFTSLMERAGIKTATIAFYFSRNRNKDGRDYFGENRPEVFFSHIGDSVQALGLAAAQKVQLAHKTAKEQGWA